MCIRNYKHIRMELNSDIWTKITEFLVIRCENETKDCDVWIEYGHLFKDLKRISKRARSGVIAYQRGVLHTWFFNHYPRSLDRTSTRKLTYGKSLNIQFSQVNYPNGFSCPYRLYFCVNFRKHMINSLNVVFTKDRVISELGNTCDNFLSKLFPDVDDTRKRVRATSTSTSILSGLLSSRLSTKGYVDTPEEIHLFLDFHNGERYGPSVIHFPQKGITYIFIYEHDKLIVSTKTCGKQFKFHVHESSEDPLILSYIRGLRSSLFSTFPLD